MKITVLVIAIAMAVPRTLAQANEFAVVIGGAASPNSSTPFPSASTRTPLKIGSGITYEGVFAHLLLDVRAVSAYLELPIAGTPSRTVSGINVATRDFSSVLFTPSLKLQLRPLAGFTPFLSIGGGFAHFNTTQEGRAGPGVGIPFISSVSNTSAALQFGAGLEFKTAISRLGLRAELRDFRTGRPDLGFPTSFLDADTQHNLFIGGGVVLHFSLPSGT
ncbi:MAG: outer membrane protein [Terriglobales bacterium]